MDLGIVTLILEDYKKMCKDALGDDYETFKVGIVTCDGKEYSEDYHSIKLCSDYLHITGGDEYYVISIPYGNIAYLCLLH